MTHPYFPYAVTEIFCIIFAAIIWMRMNRNIGSEHEVRQLRNMIYSYLIHAWFLMFCGLLLRTRSYTRPSAGRYKCHYFNCDFLRMLFWFKFIEDRLHFCVGVQKTIDKLLLIPLAVICALDFYRFYRLDILHRRPGRYQMAAWFNLQTIVNYFYLLIPTVYPPIAP